VTDLALYATLTAAAGDAAPRTAEVQIVPYDRPGRTSAGLKRIKPGAIRLVAEAPVIGLYGHRTPGVEPRGVSRLIAHEDRADGLYGRLRIAETPDGDLLLAEIRGGVREGVSVELSDVTYDPADPDLVVSARLDAVAHVPLPAYDSARVSALAATQHPQGAPRVTELAETAAAPAAPELDYTQLAAALAPHLTAAAAPAGLPTGGLTAAPAAVAEATDPVAELAGLQAAQAAGDTSLLAALSDITNSDLPIFQRPAGAVGEQLWRNHSYTRRFVPLLTSKPLTSYKVTGWEFGTGPEVGDWAGDKTEIPSNDIGQIREIETTAARLAGGWDIDRKFRDFGDAQFWTWFYGQQAESYARKSDAKARAALLAAVQPITGTAPVAGYTRPNWASAPEAQDDILSAVAVGTAYLEDTPLVEKGPDYILMNTQDWLGLLKLTNLDLPAFLSLLNVQPGSFQRSNDVPAGSVVLGVKQAVEFYELPGAAPIRVEALDVARGGIDSAVYGYWASLNVRPGGIISVPLAAAAG
jgi:HK97 family phage prohead protease